jgi:alkylation response protein AidB-like acyl-CoA dehydrogenase
MPDKSFLTWPFFEEHHRKLAVDLESWCERELRDFDHDEDVDAACRKVVKKFGDAGWLKYSVPKSGGGHHERLDVRSICLIRETLARRSGLAEFAFALQGLGSGPISQFGSDVLKQKYLPGVAAGKSIPAFAISESDAGSDLSAMQTTAKKDGSGYVVNGSKTWISNAGIADFYTVFCRYPEGGDTSYIALLVEANNPGMKVAKRIEVIAPHPLGTIEFKDCRVNADAVVGTPGKGMGVALGTLDIFRPTVGAAALGFARHALDESIAWTKNRKAFGQRLSDFQITKAKFADMALAIDASALLVYRAAWTRDTGADRIPREAAMAKLFATESAQRVIDDAVQLFGGMGVVSGHPVERLYREIRALRIYEGTSEIQKLILAEQLLKEESVSKGTSHA